MTVTATSKATWNDDVFKAKGPVLVDFWAEWCGPCRMIAPILDEIQREHSESITILKLNVDENPELAASYRITSIPNMKVFVDGEPVKSIVGAKGKAALEADLQEWLS